MTDSGIIDRGRGPVIAGTRITVYDIVDYLDEGWHPTAIATIFRISSREVGAALRYIEEHEEEVRAEYQRILARAAKGNPRSPVPARRWPLQVPGTGARANTTKRARGLR